MLTQPHHQIPSFACMILHEFIQNSATRFIPRVPDLAVPDLDELEASWSGGQAARGPGAVARAMQAIRARAHSGMMVLMRRVGR